MIPFHGILENIKPGGLKIEQCCQELKVEKEFVYKVVG